MHNPSPYDSGYDSNFSTASGPGHPPSSRGNSDIDDQVESYIRDQRVATIVHDTNPPALTTFPTPTQPNPSPSPRDTNRELLHINNNRAIAAYHHALANDPNFDEPPPLIPDSDTDDDSDEEDDPTAATPIDQLTSPPTAPPLTDDEQNQLRRTHPFGTSHTPHTTTSGHLLTFEVRTATHDSDSTPIYPNNSDSDEDHPGYWPEHRDNTPPPSNSPPPAAISDSQLADWVQSQLPWHEFRHSIPELDNIPDELCGPPNIHAGPSARHT
jgi:hypothetical protein